MIDSNDPHATRLLQKFLSIFGIQVNNGSIGVGILFSIIIMTGVFGGFGLYNEGKRDGASASEAEIAKLLRTIGNLKEENSKIAEVKECLPRDVSNLELRIKNSESEALYCSQQLIIIRDQLSKKENESSVYAMDCMKREAELVKNIEQYQQEVSRTKSYLSVCEIRSGELKADLDRIKRGSEIQKYSRDAQMGGETPNANCVTSGETAWVRLDAAFTDCSTDATVAYISSRDNSNIGVMLDGRRIELQASQSTKINDKCALKFLGTDRVNMVRHALFKVICK